LRPVVALVHGPHLLSRLGAKKKKKKRRDLRKRIFVGGQVPPSEEELAFSKNDF